jgi:hypothetical protein
MSTWRVSCLVLRCLVLRCLVLRCLVLRCLVLRCLVLRCLVLRCLVLRCLVLRFRRVSVAAWGCAFAYCLGLPGAALPPAAAHRCLPADPCRSSV